MRAVQVAVRNENHGVVVVDFLDDGRNRIIQLPRDHVPPLSGEDFQTAFGIQARQYRVLYAVQLDRLFQFLVIVAGHIDGNSVDLGFFQIFGEIDDVTELERYIPETLKKLYEYDDEHKGELIPTLQMFLSNNQSIRKTAGAMFVHYRTISYRLEKIKQISGINFDNANEVLAVSNGLIIYKMLKEIE